MSQMAGESAEQGRESASSVLAVNFSQPTENSSRPESPIGLKDHPGQQSESSNTQSNTPLVSKTSQPLPDVIARLGLWIIITNIGAVVLLVSAVSALFFLWFAGEENNRWRRVMIDGWIGQAVTLSTLAIRLAVSVQAGTAVAMLASVSIEHKPFGGVLLSEAPTLSIARYVNTGPLESLPSFLNGFRWKSKFLTLSALGLAATSLVSQFTSTLLLWDIRPSVLPGFPTEIPTGIGFSMEHIVDGTFSKSIGRVQNYWLAPPPNYPTFAEWASKPPNTPDSIMDTGPSIRSFLPIDSESDRSALLEFQGMAPAFDARVTCVRPTIKDWVFSGPKIRNYVVVAATSFNGTLFPPKIDGDIAQVLQQDIPPTGYPLHLLFAHFFTGSDPSFIVHSLPHRAGGLISSLNPMQNESFEYSCTNADFSCTDRGILGGWMVQNKENGETWYANLGHSFLLIGSHARGAIPDGTLLDLPNDTVNWNFTAEGSGPWLDFFPDSDPDHKKGVLSITMCYDALSHDSEYRVKGLQDFQVSARRKSNHSEPKIGWDPEKRAFETTSIRAQLDTQQSTSNSSVFHLDRAYLNKTLRSFRWNPKDYYYMLTEDLPVFWYFDNDTSHFEGQLDQLAVKERNVPSETYDFLTEVVWKPLRLSAVNDSFEIIVTCRNCSKLSKQSNDPHKYIVQTDMSEALSTMFLDIMKETDNPALAWQALVTTLMRMAYYDWLPIFDYTGNATVTSIVPCQKPKYWKGFMLVMANLLVHLALFISSAFWFFTGTRYSLLSNAWQAMAQMKAPETDIYLDNATMLDDKKVKQEIDRKWARRRFNVKRNDEDDRICLL